MWRRNLHLSLLLCFAFLVAVSHPGLIHAEEDCFDENYARGMAIGGVVGTGAGIVTAAAAGLTTATITAGAGVAGAGIGAAIAVDCLTTLCLGTVIAGTILGVTAGFLWLFSDDPEDCAGSIYFSQKEKKFTMSWNRDSNNAALKSGRKYCEREYEGKCEPILLFRQCAAVAQDYRNRTWAVGAESTAKLAEKKAMAECRKNPKSKNCVISLSAECNAG